MAMCPALGSRRSVALSRQLRRARSSCGYARALLLVAAQWAACASHRAAGRGARDTASLILSTRRDHRQARPGETVTPRWPAKAQSGPRTCVQKPAMHMRGSSFGSAGGQQSPAIVQPSPSLEHIVILGEQVPTGSLFSIGSRVQKPPQQSTPLVHESPSM
jgi:hypothetical protein